MSWIIFADAGKSKSGKTKEWHVLPKDNPSLVVSLGMVKWYSPWRKYTFCPFVDTIFEQDCLRGIAAFCEERTREHNEVLRSERRASNAAS